MIVYVVPKKNVCTSDTKLQKTDFASSAIIISADSAHLNVLKKNLNASKPSEHPPQVEECLKV